MKAHELLREKRLANGSSVSVQPDFHGSRSSRSRFKILRGHRRRIRFNDPGERVEGTDDCVLRNEILQLKRLVASLQLDDPVGGDPRCLKAIGDCGSGLIAVKQIGRLCGITL